MKVVNVRKTDNYDVYGGRHRENGVLKHINNTEVGKRGWLGNPYPLSDYSREESIQLFKEDFLNKWEENEKFREEVKKLAGSKVGCYCKPKDCHLEIIQKKLRKEGLIF